MLIGNLLKGQILVSGQVEQTVLEVTRMMVEHNIGAVPVLRDGQLVGIFTERDLMSRAVATGRDMAKTLVSEVMTDDPMTIDANDSLETCLTLTRRHNFRHLPVCKAGELRGIVSLRDILLHDLDEKDDEMRMMRAYLHSTPDMG